MTMSIREKYEDFVRKYNCEPSYASAIIKWNDSGMLGTLEEAIFKLSCDADERDDEIFFFINGAYELEELTRNTGEDFYVLEETVEFLKSLD